MLFASGGGDGRGRYGERGDRHHGQGGGRRGGGRGPERGYGGPSGGSDRGGYQGGRGGVGNYGGGSGRGRGNEGDGYGQGRPGGRGGDRGGGRARSGGRGRGPDLSGIKSVLCNIILANITEGFQFFLYSVDVKDAKGEAMESRFRRKFLFDRGFWDGFLKDMPEKEKEDLKRVVFFKGSFLFSGRPIPGLKPESLPIELPLDDKAEGDSIRIVKFAHYVAPTELTTKIGNIKSGEVSFDNRCADCTKSFVDVGSLLQHWQVNSR